MFDNKISVHLQDFPEISFFDDEKKLVAEMDLVRLICSSALFIRDQKNLRVRMPLNELMVIGNKAENIIDFKDIIADEINVKSVTIKKDITDVAELKLQINFKKIGAKYGPKVKEITEAVKNNHWQQIAQNQVLVRLKDSEIILIDDEFDLKLNIKNQDDEKYAKKYSFAALSSNDCLIRLDIEVTKDLQEEGIARDIIRVVQQNRKDANLNVSNRISLIFFSNNYLINEVIAKYANYIKEQTLCLKIELVKEGYSKSDATSANLFFENKIDDIELQMLIKVENL
jgi:isoleucyl-tRNA synthetase